MAPNIVLSTRCLAPLKEPWNEVFLGNFGRIRYPLKLAETGLVFCLAIIAIICQNIDEDPL
jgi:hypothetical protein